MSKPVENHNGHDIFATGPKPAFRFWAYGPAGMIRAQTIEEARAKIDADAEAMAEETA